MWTSLETFALKVITRNPFQDAFMDFETWQLADRDRDGVYQWIDLTYNYVGRLN